MNYYFYKDRFSCANELKVRLDNIVFSQTQINSEKNCVFY